MLLTSICAPFFAQADTNEASVVAVLFGYNYNDAEFVADTVHYLENRFGREDAGGIIRALVYPRDFTSGTRTRISLLRDKLDGAEALIMFGAPEDTSNILAGMNFSYPIYSFFSQDDVLAGEYVATFVIENTDQLRPIDTEALCRMTAKVIENIQKKERLLRNLQLKNELQAILGTDWIVHAYTNPETGIRAVNHFVIEPIVQRRTGTTH